MQMVLAARITLLLKAGHKILFLKSSRPKSQRPPMPRRPRIRRTGGCVAGQSARSW